MLSWKENIFVALLDIQLRTTRILSSHSFKEKLLCTKQTWRALRVLCETLNVDKLLHAEESFELREGKGSFVISSSCSFSCSTFRLVMKSLLKCSLKGEPETCSRFVLHLWSRYQVFSNYFPISQLFEKAFISMVIALKTSSDVNWRRNDFD